MSFTRISIFDRADVVHECVVVATWPDGTVLARPVYIDFEEAVGDLTDYTVALFYIEKPDFDSPNDVNGQLELSHQVDEKLPILMQVGVGEESEWIEDLSIRRLVWFVKHTTDEGKISLQFAQQWFSAIPEPGVEFTTNEQAVLPFDPEPYRLLGENYPVWWLHDAFDAWVMALGDGGLR